MADTASLQPAFASGRDAEALARGSIGPEAQLVAWQWPELDRADRIGRWDALAQWAAEPNPFYESWYLLPSLRALDPECEVELLCLEVDGQLAGLMPVSRARSYYGYPLTHLRNWVHDNCFCGVPLVARGLERPFWRSVLQWCDNHAGPALFLHLMQMPSTGPLHEALADVLREQVRPAATVMREQRALLSSELDPDAYLAQSLASKKRKELRRQQRRLSEEGQLVVERSTDPGGAAEWGSTQITLFLLS